MNDSTKSSLRYKDEADRAFGAAGMTVAVVVCNAEDILVAVDIDAPEPSDMMELADSYYLAGSRAKSVSAAWQQTLSAFRATLVMAAGNVLAREIVGSRRDVEPGMRRALHDAVVAEGVESCQLEPDEVDDLFSSTYSYLHRVFSHGGVAGVTSDFATLLRRERRLSCGDILSALSPLSRL